MTIGLRKALLRLAIAIRLTLDLNHLFNPVGVQNQFLFAAPPNDLASQ